MKKEKILTYLKIARDIDLDNRNKHLITYSFLGNKLGARISPNKALQIAMTDHCESFDITLEFLKFTQIMDKLKIKVYAVPRNLNPEKYEKTNKQKLKTFRRYSARNKALLKR